MLTKEAWLALESYRWPGNVRQLQNVVEQIVCLSATDDPVGVPQLPETIRTTGPAIVPLRERRRQVADELFQALVNDGYSFWEHIQPLLKNRDITRHDVRELVRRGLSVSRGNYQGLLPLFGLPPSHYKRFMNFLTTHKCQPDFREFRNARSELSRSPRPALVCLAPLVLVLMIRYWVPESPRWLILKGRHEEARRSLAWALMIHPEEITLPAPAATAEKTRWLELFKYPRLVLSGCLTGLTQTGGASLGLWGATLLVLVMKISPADAAYLMIWVSVSAVLGRLFITALIEPLGRRGSATLCMVCGGLGMVAQGYLYDASIGPWSAFYVLFLFQTFFGSANYSVVGPYMAEIWPARLRASGMGLSYGVGNLGKFVGPLGLALIMGAGDLIKPAAPNLVMLGPAFMYFAAWYVLGLVGFWTFGYEPRGRTFEEIDAALDASIRTTVAASALRR